MSTQPLTALQEGALAGGIAVLLFVGMVLVAIAAYYIHEALQEPKPRKP